MTLNSEGPLDGLEVVGHVKPEHPEAAEPHFVRELSQPWMTDIFTIPVVTFSQVSSVIAGLERHNQALLDKVSSEDCACAYDGPDDVCLGHSPKLKAAEARISSLEEENKRLREALKQQIPGHRDPEGNCWCRYGHNPDYGHTLSCDTARQALGGSQWLTR